MSMRYPGGLIATTPVNQQFPSGVWTGPQSTPYRSNNVWGNDPYFKNTSLLLHGDGPAAPFIKDSSVNNFNLTISGDTRSDNRTPFIENGYWSNYLSGSTSYLSVANSTPLQLSANQFTIEGWFYLTVGSTDNNELVCQSSGSADANVNYQIRITSANKLRFLVMSGASPTYFDGTTTITTNTWHHFACVCDGSGAGAFLRSWLDGVYQGASSSFNAAGINTNSAATQIGAWSYSSQYLSGYVSNFRILKGTALYTGTSNITVPTSPLTAISNTSLLTCQSNRFVDNSSNAFTITPSGSVAVNALQPFTAPSGTSLYGSGYFDGSGDYLSVLSNPAFNFGSGNFTIEFWAYSTSTSRQIIIGNYSSSGSTYGWAVQININSTGDLFLGWGNATISNPSGVWSANQWNHVAISRSGTTTKLFVNGVQASSVTDTTNYNNGNNLVVGQNADLGQTAFSFTGYISNVRIVNGTAVYTAGFTAPTSPLASIANTSLLTLQSNVPVNNNVFFDSSPNNYAITRTGSITQGSFTPYLTNGYWSNYFDGSGDRLDVANNAALQLNSGNFTMEAWVYYTTATAYFHFFSKWNSGDLEYQMAITTSSGILGTSTSSNGSSSTGDTTSSAGAVSPNVWQHVAWVRNGATDTLYVNGVSVASNAGGTIRAGTSALSFGGRQDGAYYGTGYLSNARLVKGTAVYTANFTPSTTPLTAITNTSLLTCQSNRFIDNSTNAFAITKNGDTNVQGFQPFSPALQYTSTGFSGSGYFFGASNSLATPSGTCPVINDFSASGWVYRTSVPGYQQTFFAMGIDGSGRIGFFWTGSNFEYNIYGSSTVTIDSSGSMPVGAWTYVVVTRTGSTLTLYYNGTLKATVTLSGSFSASSGRSMSWMDGTIGYATNLRFDTAAYSSPTTVPTAPVSYTANTNNLLNFTNAGIFDNAMQNALVTVGDAKISTSVVKYGTGSMYFDGTGDTLTIPGTPNLFIGTGNFTAEGWIYPTSVASARAIISFANNNVFYLNTSAIPYYGIYTVSDTALGSTPVALNTWTHIAFVRNGTTLTCYLNGVSVGSTTTSSSIGDTTTSSYVGSHRSSNYWLGYIDDLRITKGVARYVTNFTPPVARMPNQ